MQTRYLQLFGQNQKEAPKRNPPSRIQCTAAIKNPMQPSAYGYYILSITNVITVHYRRWTAIIPGIAAILSGGKSRDTPRAAT